MTINRISRRDVLASVPLFGLSSLLPATVLAQDSMPTRRIPGTDESLPVIGRGC
jgi:hypothetical protein